MIKIIAYLTMLIDHVGRVFFPDYFIFTLIGRLAFPLFAWGIAIGYKRTNNFRNYALRIFILAIVSQYPHYILFKSFYFNVCFTLLAGLLVLKMYESKMIPVFKYSGIGFLCLLAHSFSFEYGIYGIACIVIFYLFDSKYHLAFLQLASTILGIYIYKYYATQLFSIFSIGIIVFWGKYDFKLNKYLQYGFYPLHLCLLILIERYTM